MTKDDIERKIAFVDQHIGFITNLFTDKFVVVKGSLDKIGSMESSTTISTDTSGSVVGVASSGGGFGALGS